MAMKETLEEQSSKIKPTAVKGTTQDDAVQLATEIATNMDGIRRQEEVALAEKKKSELKLDSTLGVAVAVATASFIAPVGLVLAGSGACVLWAIKHYASWKKADKLAQKSNQGLQDNETFVRKMDELRAKNNQRLLMPLVEEKIQQNTLTRAEELKNERDEASLKTWRSAIFSSVGFIPSIIAGAALAAGTGGIVPTIALLAIPVATGVGLFKTAINAFKTRRLDKRLKEASFVQKIKSNVQALSHEKSNTHRLAYRTTRGRVAVRATQWELGAPSVTKSKKNKNLRMIKDQTINFELAEKRHKKTLDTSNFPPVRDGVLKMDAVANRRKATPTLSNTLFVKKNNDER